MVVTIIVLYPFLNLVSLPTTFQFTFFQPNKIRIIRIIFVLDVLRICLFEFHSTPARRHPVNGGKASNGCHKGGGGVSGAKSSRNLSEAETGTTDNDDLILKRMEEILMTSKTKVEDHLAAEGRELPKEIFEDFTSRWVQNQAQVRKLKKL